MDDRLALGQLFLLYGQFSQMKIALFDLCFQLFILGLNGLFLELKLF